MQALHVPHQTLRRRDGLARRNATKTQSPGFSGRAKLVDLQAGQYGETR